MRLIDKWFIQNRKEVSKAAFAPPVSFVVDNIARDYYHDDRDEFSGLDFPYSIPPWPRCFIEWAIPQTRRTEGVVESSPRGCATMAGGLIVAMDGPDDPKAILRDCRSELVSDQDMITDGQFQATQRGFTFIPVMEIGGVVFTYNFFFHVFTTDVGTATATAISGIDVSKLTAEAVDSLKITTRTMFHVICYAFTFANCKNVATVDSTADLKPRDKIERRLKLPSFKRYTLKIDGKQTARADGNGNIGSPAYHLCRGHFATYTPERPLFGRLHGKFWIPAHTRGNKSRGEVEKGYSA